MTISKEQQPKSPFPSPNLHDPESLRNWLDYYIHTPSTSFENLKHADGTPYTKEGMIIVTRRQYFRWAQEYREDQVMLGKISAMLMKRASPKIPTKT